MIPLVVGRDAVDRPPIATRRPSLSMMEGVRDCCKVLDKLTVVVRKPQEGSNSFHASKVSQPRMAFSIASIGVILLLHICCPRISKDVFKMSHLLAFTKN